MYIRIPFALVGIACMSFAAAASAHPRESLLVHSVSHSALAPIRVAVASDDDSPRVRLRGDSSGKGLSPQAFSRWISRHPALIHQQTALSSMRVLVSTATQRLNNAVIFDIADANQDGRVSADELADFLTRNAPPRVPTDAT